MSITLSVGATVVQLPADLYWEDEYTWAPVEQAVERTITGALVIDLADKIGGRPFTLGRDPDGADTGWIKRVDLDQLRTWASVAGQQMVLTLRGEPHTVIWAHHDGEAIDATPVLHFTDVINSDIYRITLRLMEI